VLFYRASDPSFGRELWSSDGTAGNTAMVKDIEPLGESTPDNLSVVDGQLFFSAILGGTNAELWTSDGTSAGTIRVKDINAGDDDLLSSLVAVGSIGFFKASDGSSGEELWKTDGTEGGTVRVKDIKVGSDSGVPLLSTANAVALNGTLYFVADDGASGLELWKSNGTEAGTVLVKDICPGVCSSNPLQLVAAGNDIYFTASNPYVGGELWISDGTESGTRLAFDLATGTETSGPLSLQPSGNLVYFSAAADGLGRELWAACITDTTHLGITGPASSVSAAVASIEVSPLDAANALVPCYTGMVHFTSSDANATLPDDYTFIAGEGAHAFDVTLRSLGSHSVTATDTVTGTIIGSINISVGASPVTSTITATPESIVADGTSTSTITVQYKNAEGTDLTAGGGTLTLNTTAGSLSVPLNNNDGTYTATLTSSTSLAEATIGGVLDGVTMTDTAAVAFTAGAAASFLVSAPAAVSPGVPFHVTITARDANGHTATGYTGTIHFTSSDASATLPSNYTFVGGDNGVHTFTSGVTLNIAGVRSITATDTVTASIAGSANVTVNPISAPVIVAGATATNSVTINWNALSGAAGYDVLRSTNNGPFTVIGQPEATAFVDGPVSANTSYLYKVRGRDPGGNGGTLSAPDVATTVLFTDDPLVAGSTRVKAVHVTQLRTAVNALRAFAALSAATFTDPTLNAGTRPKAAHLTELRTALNQARTALALGALPFTDPIITVNVTRIKAAHLTELRDGVR
jgi:ELWxxDGT repeat protein